MRVLLAWSSGKDSAWALHVLRATPGVEVVGLLTTLSEALDRVAVHGVARALLEAQARAAGLPLRGVSLPSPCPNAVYERALHQALDAARAEQDVGAVAFGDLFLADIRRYREALLGAAGLAPLFPLWGRDTAALAREMLAGGLRARLVCVDPRQLPGSWAGRAFDHELLAQLPPGVDPCGENGEFHTFAWDGPMFDRPVHVQVGALRAHDGLACAELTPAEA